MSQDESEQGRPLTRRQALRLFGFGATAAVVAACAPTTGGVSASVAPSSATTAAATSAPATAAAATPAPATPSPTPQRTPFSIASMANPLIDNHAHPIVPSQGDQTKYYDGIVDLMDKNGVAMTVLHRNAEWVNAVKFGPEHDDWVRAAMDRHPGRILGFLAGFDPASPDAPNYVRTQLQNDKERRWKAIGELDLRNPGPKTQIPINSPIMMQIHRIAAEFGVPVVFHYNPDYGTPSAEAGFREIEDAVAKNPNTTFVLAHNPPAQLMPKYPNLWGEVTLFNPQFPSEQILQQLGATPGALDRLVLCVTDLQTPDLRVIAGLPTPLTYAEAVIRARDLLAKQSPDVRDKIGYKNLMRLLKLQ